jgi:NADH-quinone oxidoreductase subunit A
LPGLPYFCYQSNFKEMEIFLLQANPVSAASDVNSSLNYLPIGIQFLFAIGFVVLILGVTHLLGPRRKTSDKLENFESGIESVGNARQPMAIKYFLVAILFVLFDVEVIFFYPYAVNFRELGWAGFFAVLLFVAFFLVGFIYIIKKGALNWED